MARILLFFLINILFSCSTSEKEQENVIELDSTISRQATIVKTQLAVHKNFSEQIFSNGKIFAAQEIPLSFQITGIIMRINIRNGSMVRAGQLLASLENNSQKLALKEAELQLSESWVEINDLLITQGGRRLDSLSVSPGVYSYIKLKSGHDRALLAVQKAKFELAKTFLYSPVSGKVANLTLTSYSTSPSDKPFCTLLNSTEMMLQCPILETELTSILSGQIAKIEPVGLPGIIYEAKVTDINPIVNGQGLVDVTIKILKPDARLLSGMNVRVIIEKSFSKQLVIPKEAVVERSGRKVVFTYSNEGAKWHYVTTGPENDREVTIYKGLEAGDEVIISGNLNLGNDGKVKKIVE